MADLLLDSLEIRNFRAFSCLQIEKLGRVNLITGKNGVGKSCVLEALRYFAANGSPFIIREILTGRQEWQMPDRKNGTTVHPSLENVKALFWDRQMENSTLAVGTIEGAMNRVFSFLGVAQEASWTTGTTLEQWTISTTALLNEPQNTIIPVRFPCQYVPANGLVSDRITQLWDETALTDSEDAVIEALRLILPDVQRISLIGEAENVYVRFPVVKVKNQSGPVPLKSLGDGMNRLFGLTLALVNAQDGMLLLDEIENGLHYSIQPEMWRLIFEVAKRLNVQVFATTHSWDCITAFQKASKDDTDSEGVLIRLRNRNETLEATTLDEEQLEIVTHSGLEVRG